MILLLNKRQVKPGLNVVEMQGSIHAGTDCRRVENEVEGLIRAGDTLVVFDMTGITHVDSAAIGSIVRCLTQLKKSSGSLRLVGLQGMVCGALKLTKVDRIIETFPTVAAALENFAPPADSTASSAQ